ncbi:hypothetical protein [Paenarthrobacter sp. NPDC089316]|uniref:hypothetical protein n=1 Tax=unclassified Paenarthrobacter TaxID=2634190 RepID=UPI003420451D
MTENIPPTSPAPTTNSNQAPEQGPYVPAVYGQQPYPQRFAPQYAPAPRPGLPDMKVPGRRKAAGIVGIILGVLFLLPALVMLEDTHLGFMALLIFLTAFGNITVGILILVKFGARTKWAPVTLLSTSGTAVMLGIIGPLLDLFNFALLIITLPLAIPIALLLGSDLAKQKRLVTPHRALHFPAGPYKHAPETYAPTPAPHTPNAYALPPEAPRATAPRLPERSGGPAPFQLPAAAGRSRISAPWWWAIGGVAAVLIFAGLLLGSVFSQQGANADACTLYEKANNDLTSAIESQKAGILSQADVRAEFKGLPARIKAAADMAHGDVLVEMQESYRYAATYQASQTEDNGRAFFLQQNSVIDACKDAGTQINLD